MTIGLLFCVNFLIMRSCRNIYKHCIKELNPSKSVNLVQLYMYLFKN